MNAINNQEQELPPTMMLSEFINILSGKVAEHGDMPVVIQASDNGDFVGVPKNFDLVELYPYDLDYTEYTIEEIDAMKAMDALSITCCNDEED